MQIVLFESGRYGIRDNQYKPPHFYNILLKAWHEKTVDCEYSDLDLVLEAFESVHEKWVIDNDMGVPL